MPFSISFSLDHRHPDYASGSISLGSHIDYFRASTSLWKLQDYETQWREALEIVTRDGVPTALITDLYDPASASLITWWPMWRDGGEIRIQNQLLIFEQLPTPFNPQLPYEHMGEYSGAVTDDGEKTSEWKVPVLDVLAFLRTGHTDATINGA